MHVVGKLSVGASAFELPLNEKRAFRVSFLNDSLVVKLSAYMDGGGSGGGDMQAVRAVLYDSGGTLFATGDEVVVEGGAAGGWVDLPFPIPGGVSVPAGDYDIGVISGDETLTARMFGDAAASGTSKKNADTYSDGPTTAFGASTALSFDLSIFATTFVPYFVPEVDEFFYASLPFAEAQTKLGEKPPPKLAVARKAMCSWHGTSLDDREGSFLVVKTDGAFTDLIGQRVLVRTRGTAKKRGVYAYCHTEADLVDDVSLTRNVFAHLSLIPVNPIPVTVTVVKR